MASEREETLIEQLQLRDARIEELEKTLAESIKVMEELANAGTVMLQAWDIQQKRLAILEAAVKGPTFPNGAN